MNHNKKTAKSRFFWRLFISGVGIALILLAVVNFSLFLFGETASCEVSVRRYGGAQDGRPVSQRYEWSVDYTFTDKNGLLHSGHTTRRGSDLSVKTDHKVYYFAFAPAVNALESDAEPNLMQLLFIASGTFLLIVMNRKQKPHIGRNTPVERNNMGNQGSDL